MNEISDNTAVIIRDLAHAQAQPAGLEPGSIYGWLSDGNVHLVDLTGDQYRAYPRRKRGTVLVRDVASFAHYHGKHSAMGVTEVFADLNAGTFTAVLDAHEAEDAGWQEHRLILQLEHTLPWKTWLANDRKMLTQQQFAEFLEDNARDVAPDGRVTAADLLEISQSFQASTQVKFTSGTRLATGQTQLTYVEETEAKAGKRGTVEIPAEFDLAIVPYEDCKPKVMAARFRYRLDHGELRLGYFLNDPARTAREAVAAIAQDLAIVIDDVIMQGQPAR